MLLLSCQSLPVSLAMFTNLIRRDYCISLYGTITITSWWCHCDVIMVGLMVSYKQTWWGKDSSYITYNNTTLIKYWPRINTFALNSLKSLSPNFVSDHWKNSLAWNLSYIRFEFFATSIFYLCVYNLKCKLKAVK